MGLADRIRQARGKVIVLSVVAAALTVGIAWGIAGRGDADVTVASAFKDVPIDQTIQVGGVSVTLEQLRLGAHETQLQYRYDAPPGGQVEPLGIPTIGLPSGGDQLQGEGGGFDGFMPITRTFTFPALPEGADTITVDVGSFLEYAPPTASVEVPLGNTDVPPDDIGRRTLPLDVAFSVGEAQYRVTKLLLDPGSFVLVCEPANDAASRMALGGGQSENISLTDSQGGSYDGFLSDAMWSPAGDGGHVLLLQGFHFEGLPNPSATSLTLNMYGASHIRAPFVFRVDIPQEEDG